MLLRQHSTLLSSLHFAAKTSFRITLITTIITYNEMLYNNNFDFYSLLPSDSLFLTFLLYEDPEGVLVLARLLLLSITMIMTLTLGSQWRCHRHVYTALIITLSHFNSSSVNWTASGFSRGSSHSCCRVDVAPWPIRCRSQRGEKCPRLLWSSELPDPSESDVWCAVMSPREMSPSCHVPCPARSQMSNMSFLQSWHFNFHDIELAFRDGYFNFITTCFYSFPCWPVLSIIVLSF